MNWMIKMNKIKVSIMATLDKVTDTLGVEISWKMVIDKIRRKKAGPEAKKEVSAVDPADDGTKDDDTKKEKPKAKETAKNPNWVSIPILLVLFFVGYIYWGKMIIAVMLLLVGLGFVEIKTPYLGFLYVRGKLRGQRGPGWYIIIPIIMTFEKKSMEITGCVITEKMYTKGKTPIDVKIACWWQVIDLELAVDISDEQLELKIQALMASQTKTAIGKKSFEELLEHKRGLEDTIMVEIQEQVDRNGYEITTFELADFDENVESKAAEIKVIGAAEAKAAGDKTKAISDNVDSWKGAAGMFAEALGNFVGQKATKEFDKKIKTPKASEATEAAE